MELPTSKVQSSPVIKLLCEVERDYIAKVYEQMKFCKVQTAKALGIGRATLYRKLRHYGIDKRKMRSSS